MYLDNLFYIWKNLMKWYETSRATLLMANAGNILFKDRITIYKIPSLDVISSNSQIIELRVRFIRVPFKPLYLITMRKILSFEINSVKFLPYHSSIKPLYRETAIKNRQFSDEKRDLYSFCSDKCLKCIVWFGHVINFSVGSQ